MARPERDAIPLANIVVDRVDMDDAVGAVEAGLRERRGGHVVTPNVDIIARCRRDEALAGLVNRAELALCDGAPLVWASKVAGTPLPGRVAGSDLVWRLAERGSHLGWKMALLGGTPDPSALPTQRAGEVLEARHPGVKVVGRWCPPMGFERDATHWEALAMRLRDTRPDVVLVGLGFPKQEVVIDRLRSHAPETWFVGCGASIDFIAGYRSRAPRWMRRNGLEWAHRMWSEPRRLTKRYLLVDAPVALGLMGEALQRRFDRFRLRG
ncbi:WecB/TagA/CpsF family glycosyltransferase [Salininema proteolyticum]|uniref:WecB/TagA/CpsF family glycosyltransferase n=1 Tax=Salininema proteolyticum TaxID=1607685 RepID=A0ABV8TYA0_9ACTN